jgi:ABC-type uncharacterized transport system permease subunit
MLNKRHSLQLTSEMINCLISSVALSIVNLAVPKKICNLKCTLAKATENFKLVMVIILFVYE